MIIAHEGLPRSGKSYEAIIMMVEWLKARKKIYTNIAGMDHQVMASLACLTLEECRLLLIQLSNKDIPRIYEVVPLPDDQGNGGETDIMIVIDELQDYFPADRSKLSSEMSTWIASHGHAGWHILIMGQDTRDFHNIWRRRIQRKIIFTKLTALGAENRYKWEALEAKRPEKFQSIGSGTKKYDPKYFGAYKSHSDGVEQKGAVMDKRTIIWRRPGFMFGIPAMIIATFFAIDVLIDFFTPATPLTVSKNSVQTIHSNPPAVQQRPVYTAQPQSAVKEPTPKTPEQIRAENLAANYSQNERYVIGLSDKYRPRLTGVIKNSIRETCLVMWLDTAYRAQEQFTCEQLAALGFSLEHLPYGLKAAAKDESIIITAWPLEPFGSIAEAKRNDPAVGGS